MGLNTKYIPRILIVVIVFSLLITFDKTIIEKKFDITNYNEEL
jgi:hypothetical protein